MDNTASATTTIDLLRHGECEGGDIFRGSTDVALSESGWDTMRHAINTHAADTPWEQLVSSPLKRCRHFAEAISRRHNISLTIEDDFRELNFGDWDGLERRHLRDSHKETLRLLQTDPASFNPPGGESMLAFQRRVQKAWHRLPDQYRGRHLLSIQHGGTIRMILTHLLSIPLSSMAKINVPYGSFTRINIHHGNHKDNAVLMFHK